MKGSVFLKQDNLISRIGISDQQLKFTLIITMAVLLLMPLFYFNTPAAAANVPGSESYKMPLSSLNNDDIFSQRRGHTSVALSDGTIVLMGGCIANVIAVNDVWKSVDGGETWTEVNSDADWQPRGWHESVVLPDDTIILMGGSDYANDDTFNDVWRSIDQGATWEQMTASAGWAPREGLSGLVLGSGENVTIVITGGGYEDHDGPINMNDIWVSIDQGASWSNMVEEADWSARSYHSTASLSDGSFLIIGGHGDSGPLNDVWHISQDNGSWAASQVNADAEWTARAVHTSVVLSDDTVILMGGYNYDDQGFYFHNDVWMTEDNGATWTAVTANADWIERFGHSCVVLPGADESIILIGGRVGNWNHSNQVWRSNDGGASWTQLAGFPVFQVYPQFNWISGNEWAVGAEISINIYDGVTEVFSETTESDQWGFFYFNLWDNVAAEPFIELEPGLMVVIEDQYGFSTSHTIKDLEITGVDVENDIVSGLANSPGSQVVATIWTDNRTVLSSREATADSNREWIADFSSEDIDYFLAIGISVSESDNDGNTTFSFWQPPVIGVNPELNSIWGHDWPCDVELTITVNGDQYTTRTGEGWDWMGCTDFSFEHEDLEFEAGDLITVTDGNTIKEHIATALREVTVDAANDTVSGYAEPGSIVVVDVYDGPSEIVTAAETDGSWLAQFDEGTIGAGSSGNAHQKDDDWDETHIYWEIHAPFFLVNPEHNAIWGHNWPCDVELTITVKGVEYTTQTGESAGEGWDWVGCTDFSLEREDLEFEAGDLITVTDGVTTKEHIVRYVEITEIDVDEKTVYGKADPGTEIFVGVHEQEHTRTTVVADVNGDWSVNFTGIYDDFGPGTGGYADIGDEDGDVTVADWSIHRDQMLYASFADAVYAYEGNQWIVDPIAHAPALSLAAHEGNLYGAFGDGVYLYDSHGWDPEKITPGVASSLASFNGQLYGSFADATYVYDGNQWNHFNWPTSALAAGENYLYASFVDAVYAYDGSQWVIDPIAHAPALAMVVHDGLLYGAFEDGVYVYDGSSWNLEKITPGVASSLASYDGQLYGSFADATYVYDGNQWTIFTWPTAALAAY